jgi:hypothetical protein
MNKRRDYFYRQACVSHVLNFFLFISSFSPFSDVTTHTSAHVYIHVAEPDYITESVHKLLANKPTWTRLGLMPNIPILTRTRHGTASPYTIPLYVDDCYFPK